MYFSSKRNNYISGTTEKPAYLHRRGDIVEDRRELLPQAKYLCARRVEGGGHGALAAVPAPGSCQKYLS